MIHLINKYYAVEIPEDAANVVLWGGRQVDEIHFITMPKPGKFKQHSLSIPLGDYNLLGTSDQLTEHQAGKIIVTEWESATTMTELAKNYLTGKMEYDWSCVKSFQSLLKSKGLTRRYAILQQLNK